MNSNTKCNVAEFKKLKQGKGACNYKFSITDSIGSETLAGVKDYKFHFFPNDVKTVTLWLLPSPMIRINFDTESITSSVAITLDDPNARELARGILAGILDIIRPFETRNYLFDPARGLSIALLFAAYIVAWVAGSNLLTSRLLQLRSDQAIIIGGTVTAVFVFPLAWFVHRLRPYMTFETRLNQSRARIWNWFVFGVFGSLVAGVILLAAETLWKP